MTFSSSWDLRPSSVLQSVNAPAKVQVSAQERVMPAMKWAFVVSGFLLIVVMVRIPAKTPRFLDPRVELLTATLALLNLALAFGARPFIARMAGRASRGGSTAICRWFAANVFSLACIESRMLFGFVLHLLSGFPFGS